MCVFAAASPVLWAGPQEAGEGSFIWHEGPLDPSPRLDVALLFFLFPSVSFFILRVISTRWRVEDPAVFA